MPAPRPDDDPSPSPPPSRLRRLVETRIDPFAQPPGALVEPGMSLPLFVWRASRPARPWLLLLAGLSMLVGIADALLMIAIGAFVDLLAQTPPEAGLSGHAGTLVALGLFVIVLQPALQLARSVVSSQVVTPQFVAGMQWQSYRYAMGHALGYFQSDLAGRVSQRILQVGGTLRGIVMTVLDSLVTIGIFVVSTAALLAALAPLLLVPIVLWAAGFLVLARLFVPRAMAVSERRSAARSNLTAQVVDTVANVSTLKLFARGELERDRVRAALERSLRAGLDASWLVTGTFGILSLLNGLLVAGLAATALLLWRDGALTPGGAAAALALALRLTSIAGGVMMQMHALFENVGTLKEAMRTVAAPRTVVDRPDAVPLVVPRGGGAIRFEDVTFRYGGETQVLERFRLDVAAGERIGLVGPSGAGKSTIVSLLLRLHDLEGGRILVDGQDIARVTQDSLRAQIGVVTQDVSLLHRSVADNIAYGRPGASPSEIEAAARAAHAHAFIEDLVDSSGRRGYDAHVGERGIKLSGGQRQRIAIARVLLKDAPILVLDEATSALDSETEAAIQAALVRLMEGRTVIAIAHRLSTISALDRLIVLDRGRIVEEGGHAALLARGGVYARLWERQSRGFLPEEALSGPNEPR
ncbi:ABC transporter ATP-binding protein [Salinarimonas sp.]|uniref:ABC transporter ATP-binding protein n=1 Tax=Salinarimonas sp. TaxID=2766526 RepID=UPI00391D63E0